MTATRPGDRLMLLDAASLYFRAFFGVPDDSRTADGRPNNAVRGLLDFIARLVRDHEPNQIVACWDDGWRPTWRVALVPSYKTHRVAGTVPDAEVMAEEEAPDDLAVQVPMIRDCLEALGIAIAGADDFEADDVIATLAARADGPVDVVTGDRDLFQLVDDDRGVRVLYTAARGVSRADVIDAAAVEAKYGVRPDQYADFATLRGDTSDGLPGAKGIGEKTAATLLGTYENLDGVLAAADDDTSKLKPGVRKNLRAAADYLPKAKLVVQVAIDAPIEFSCPVGTVPHPAADPDRWSRLAEEYGLGGAARRVERALAPDGD